MAFCTQCGTNLPEAARFCPACGAAMTDTAPPPPSPAATLQRARRGGNGGLILPAMIVLALAVIGFFLWSQRDGLRPIAGGEPATDAKPPAEDDATDATRTTVAAIDAAFRDDPAAAGRRYPGAVTVRGTVVSTTGGSSPSLSLEGRTRFNYVVANLAQGAALPDVARGGSVTLTCDRASALAGTTILHGCTPA